jgi:sugar lactone lactonase YvrE
MDMLAGDMLSLDAAGLVVRKHVGEVAAVWRPRVGGGGVLGVERGFALIDVDGAVQVLPEVFQERGIRMNEGGCDPQGRFYCGTLAYDETPGAGTLFRLDVDYSVHTILTGITISNGIVWSTRGDTVYYVDSATGGVDAFDFVGDDGSFSNRRQVVSVEVAAGSPDGVALDEEGGLWVAIWGEGTIRRYLPDGRCDAVIRLPATQVTACAFGGPEMDQLYITTSRLGLAEDEQPQAGALFVSVPGVRGARVLPFAG